MCSFLRQNARLAKAAKNVVDFLLKNPLHSLGYMEKVQNKSDGRPLPEISVMKKYEKLRAFNSNWYQMYSSLTIIKPPVIARYDALHAEYLFWDVENNSE